MPMQDTQKPTADDGPVERGVRRLLPERAAIGDVVACDVRLPRPQTLRLKLGTQAAADHANMLLTLGSKVWRLEKRL